MPMTCRKCSRDIPDGAPFCPWCGIRQTPAAKATRKRGNGQGTAIRRGKTWTAIWTERLELLDHGVRQVRRWKSGFTTKTAALAYAAAPPAPSAPEPPVYRPTLKDYYDAWLASDYLDIGKSKQCAYKIAWRKLEPLHTRPVCELTIRDLQDCVDDQAETYYPAKDMRTLLSHIYSRAVAEGQAHAKLSAFVRIPPLDETAQQPFTAVEVTALWTSFAAGKRVAGLVLLMIYSGMMPGELKLCKTDMINIETCEIIGCGLKTKKRKETPIVYPAAVSSLVEALIATTPSRSGYLIGMSKDSFYDEYHAALAAAGVRDLPPYSCRHTTATALAAANAAPSVIQEIMRHTKFATTERYIHPDMSSAHAAIDTLKTS